MGGLRALGKFWKLGKNDHFLYHEVQRFIMKWTENNQQIYCPIL